MARTSSVPEVRLDAAQQTSDRDTLRRLLADLPNQPLAAPAPPAAAPEPLAAPAAPSTALAAPSDRVLAVFGAGVRKGKRVMPAHARAVAVFGGCEFDLREAIFPEAPVVIECYAVFGGVEIVVPPDIEVRTEGIGVLGGFESSAGLPAASDAVSSSSAASPSSAASRCVDRGRA